MRKIKAAGLGVFQNFMETYDPEIYREMHPKGPKGDYLHRLYALDVAMEAGFDDVGMGALFGLGDPWFELLASVAHARHRELRGGAGYVGWKSTFEGRFGIDCGGPGPGDPDRPR